MSDHTAVATHVVSADGAALSYKKKIVFVYTLNLSHQM